MLFGLSDRLDELIHVGAHSDGSDVNVSVGLEDLCNILLPGLLSGSLEFSNSAQRRSFGALSARVGVDFIVDDEYVDVFTGGDNVI